METQAEAIQPAHQPNPIIKAKFNKYIAIILILAIIVALLFYFKPLPHKAAEVQENEKILPNETEKLPEALPIGELVDVDVVNLQIPASLGFGNAFSASFVINNTLMNDTIKDAAVNVKIDDAVVYEDAIKDLAVNKSDTFGFTFVSKDEFYPVIGEHTLEIFVNGYSVKTKDFEVTERLIAPNLEIRSLSTAPSTKIEINDNVTLIAYVRNVGSLDAANATIRFYVGDVLLKEESADIAQQITTPFKTYWTPIEADDYTLKVAAYASGDVYTDNNEYAMNITVIEAA